MRKQNLGGMRKFLIAAIAVVLFPATSSNQAFAQTGDWNDIQNSVTGGGTVNLINDITAVPGSTSITVPDSVVRINGQNGANKHTISGHRVGATGETAPQLIKNTSTGGLTVENVHMTQGGGANGGAIGNTGELIINNSDFTKNTTQQPTGGGGVIANTGKGGAIYNEKGNVTVNHSNFSDNGVYTDDDGNIIYIDDDGNVALPENGGKPSTTIMGGAIYNGKGTAENPNTLTIQGGSKFENNYAAMGGAVYNTDKAIVKDSTFTNNHAVIPVVGTTDGNYGLGGAIMNSGGSLSIDNSLFEGNTASLIGGAIYNTSAHAVITNSEFKNNSTTTTGSGGALGNYKGGTYDISNTKFIGNSAGSGGAIYNSSLESDTGLFTKAVVNLTNTDFKNNYAQTTGGAIWSYGETKITNSRFIDNGVSADSSRMTSTGGAIYNSGKLIPGDVPSGELNVDNVYFEGNVASNGGAVANTGDAVVQNSSFVNNGYSKIDANTHLSSKGGAIYNSTSIGVGGASSITVKNTEFTGNVAQSGGAFYNDSAATISTSSFVNNGKSQDGAATTVDGGAIYNASNKTINIVDSSFRGNEATRGGALYGGAGSTNNITAENYNVVFGSAAGSATADTVFLDSGAIANMNARANKVIQFNSAVGGQTANHAIININPNAGYDGRVEFNAAVTNSDINLTNGTLKFGKDEHLGLSNNLNILGGTLDMMNGAVNSINPGVININGNVDMILDVDIANEKMDNLLNDGHSVNYTSGGINIAGMRTMSDSRAKDVAILFTDVAGISGNGAVTSGVSTIDGPIYKYAVKQMYDNGATGKTAGEYFVFNSIGNSDSVLLAPVAAQLGGFLMQDNLYRQSFANMDMTMLLTRAQRQAMKFRNKYASTDDVTSGLYQPSIIGEERDGFWVRPFSNFESVPLAGGPTVSNVSYGSLFGGDSDIIELGHGWDATFSFFGAYHGSHQAYNGIGIWQNGASLGAVGVAYKGNFFTGLTANVGASAVEGNSEFGNEHFPMLMTGAAWKSGYNFELAGGRFILQPSYMMSYTMVNAFDYTNAGGVRITQDPLNVIELIPGVKLIANLQGGWQPYLGVNMTWNLMDKTKFYANDVALDRLSVDPFVEYGVGLQKRVGDRFTGYGQAMLRNGGRNGIALTMGWRWALGD